MELHLENAGWDEETVALTADDHICLICSVKFLVRTEKVNLLKEWTKTPNLLHVMLLKAD